MDSFKSFIQIMLRLILFYILLQRAATTQEDGYKDLNTVPELTIPDKLSYQDKLISTFHTLFRKRSISNESNKLSEVTNALDQIKDELLKFNKDGVLEIEIPQVQHQRRYKRDISNETVETTTENNVTQNNVTTTETDETITENITVKTTDEAVTADSLQQSNDTESPTNGRRMMLNNFSASTKIKEKLLMYLEDTFNEVETKIKPLTAIKVALSSDDNYRIGYIIATIDTLEVNLRKLKNEMNAHQSVWDDEKIVELFDRIKATSSAATTLIETLKKYLPHQ